MTRIEHHWLAPAAALLALAGCASGPGEFFSYSEDRCYGGHNQCQNSCKSIDSGPARSACLDRCLGQETLCYAAGDGGAGSTLAQNSLIGQKRAEAKKEEDYKRWKAERDQVNADSADNQNTPNAEK